MGRSPSSSTRTNICAIVIPPFWFVTSKAIEYPGCGPASCQNGDEATPADMSFTATLFGCDIGAAAIITAVVIAATASAALVLVGVVKPEKDE
jgi:hypothetical protein